MDTSHQKDCGQDTKVNWNALWQFYQWSDPEVLTKILIRPHLEYAAPMWSPELIKDINKLENVQKFALRACIKQWNLPYEDLIEKCQVPELSIWRNHLSLSLLHKVISGECFLPNDSLSPITITYFSCSHEANR